MTENAIEYCDHRRRPSHGKFGCRDHAVVLGVVQIASRTCEPTFPNRDAVLLTLACICDASMGAANRARSNLDWRAQGDLSGLKLGARVV